VAKHVSQFPYQCLRRKVFVLFIQSLLNLKLPDEVIAIDFIENEAGLQLRSEMSPDDAK